MSANIIRYSVLYALIILTFQCGSIVDSDIEQETDILYKDTELGSIANPPSLKETVAISSLIVEAVVKDIRFEIDPIALDGDAFITLSVLDN